ncbi:DUF1385 domain-containing protein [Candidatus Peregrinibacteria bacterium]|nr:DUF1385 domain-containing protein [Candidatus Peregrinibacteria bacterium]
MNILKNPLCRINFLVLSWAIEALNQDVGDRQQTEEPLEIAAMQGSKPFPRSRIPGYGVQGNGAADEAVNDFQRFSKFDFAVGGQAVVEGVMMRSPNSITIAVRKPNGEISMKKRNYRTLTQRFKLLNVPILRGMINLFEMMIIGTDAINYSATVTSEAVTSETTVTSEASNPSPVSSPAIPNKPSNVSKLSKFFEYLIFAISFILAIALSIFLFKFIPLWITTFLEAKSSYIQQNYIIFNLIDGALKMSIFLSYIFILSLIPNFRRIFEYHGAEHKSIFNYENNLPLTVENANRQIRFHPRCGTSFILIVFVISILVYTFVPKQPDFWTNLFVRVAILPFIAGISYEYLKLSAKHAKNPIVKALIQPGLWFQRLTTKEPDKNQLAVGLASLEQALAMEVAGNV